MLTQIPCRRTIAVTSNVNSAKIIMLTPQCADGRKKSQPTSVAHLYALLWFCHLSCTFDTEKQTNEKTQKGRYFKRYSTP